MEKRNGFDFAIGPEEATTAAKGEVSGSRDTKETVVRVVLCVRDGRGDRGTLKVERGTRGTEEWQAVAGSHCPGRLYETGFMIHRLKTQHVKNNISRSNVYRLYGSVAGELLAVI